MESPSPLSARDPSRLAVKYRGREFVGEVATWSRGQNYGDFIGDSRDFARATIRGTAIAIGVIARNTTLTGLQKMQQNTTTPDDWVEAHGDYLFNFAIGQLRDASVAEDLVQDTFLAAFKSRNHAVTLRLEGRVVGPWVAELQKSCEAVLTEGRPLKLHLADVEFMDTEGVALLSRLRSGGVALVECPPFTEEQLKVTGR